MEARAVLSKALSPYGLAFSEASSVLAAADIGGIGSALLPGKNARRIGVCREAVSAP
jgi:hypothetical protein